MASNRDHGDEYFRRLQSYSTNSRSRTSAPQGPRGRPSSRPGQYSESTPRGRPHRDSRTNSYADTVDGSEITPPKKSRTKPRLDSRMKSYADTLDESEIAPPKRSRPRPVPDSRTHSYADTDDGSDLPPPRDSKTRPRSDARARSYADSIDDSVVTPPQRVKSRPYIDSRTNSYTDAPDGSEVTPPRRSKRRSRPDSLAKYHPDPTTRARPDSYASSYLSSDLDEKSEYGDRRPRRINADLLRQYDDIQTGRRETWWTRGRKICVGVIVAVIILIIIIVGAVVGSRKGFKYTPSFAQVNNTIAFQEGGATHQSVNITNDGIGIGQDIYTYYKGDASQFPDPSRWVSFEDMWTSNLPNVQKSCQWLGYPPDNSATDNAYLFNAIQDRANASLVDHRFVLAIVLQESHGCVRVGGTTSSGGVTNPGLMQSHEGDSYSNSNPWLSILLMIQDGVQGTKSGDGLVQLLNIYGDPYSAARAYNSGYVPKSGQLSEASGATACYVSDVANRLTGWVNADSTCPGGAS